MSADALPTTSVAEFREAAWPVVDRSMPGRVTMRLHLTWGVLGGTLVLTAVGLVGLAQHVPASGGVVAGACPAGPARAHELVAVTAWAAGRAGADTEGDRVRFVTKVDDIPMTSVAEFRQAARQVYVHHLPGSVSMGIYLTWGALGGAIAVLAFGLAGLAVTAQSWWFVLAGLLFLGLVVRRIRNVFRRAAATRAQVLELSRDVDARAARGEILMTPPGWPGGVPAPPGT